MIVYTAPERIPSFRKSLFLAGSIEQGTADEWQSYVIHQLQDTDWTILNPRRLNWDASWEQSIDNPFFCEQVEWELTALEYASMVLMYFAPNTLSPISLLELGRLSGHTANHVTVVCPTGFWRKGNVDIVATKAGMRQVETLDAALKTYKELYNG